MTDTEKIKKLLEDLTNHIHATQRIFDQHEAAIGDLSAEVRDLKSKLKDAASTK